MPVRVYIGCYTEKLGFVDGAGSGITTADVDMATGAVTVAPGTGVTPAGVRFAYPFPWTYCISFTLVSVGGRHGMHSMGLKGNPGMKPEPQRQILSWFNSLDSSLRYLRG